MRIYILSNSAVIKKNIMAKLEPYFHSTRQVTSIWSINGLLHLENAKLYQVRIKDVLSKKTLLGAYPATIDESEFIRDEEECSQIAPRAYMECVTMKSYRLPNFTSEWVLEFKDDELHDNYFSLPNSVDIHSPALKAELLQFLHL